MFAIEGQKINSLGFGALWSLCCSMQADIGYMQVKVRLFHYILLVEPGLEQALAHTCRFLTSARDC